MADGGALHRALHRTGTTARADVETAQAHLVTHLLGVLVLGVADGVATPAHDQIRAIAYVQQTRVAQDMEHGVGDVRRIGEIEAAALDDVVRDEHHVAEHGEQVLLDAADHLAIDEGLGRRVMDVQTNAPGVPHDLDVEGGVAVEDFLGIVRVGAAVQDGERAFAEQRVEAALARVEQLADLGLREMFETSARANVCVDELRNDDTAFHALWSPSYACWALMTRWPASRRQYLDRRVVFQQQPDLQHVGVGNGNAAVGPVAARVVGGRVLELVGQPMDHDRAAGIPAVAAGMLHVGFVRQLT